MNNFKLFDRLLRKGSWYASSIINNNINWIWLELPIAIFSDNVTSFSATILVLLSHFVSINFFFWRSFFSFFFLFFSFSLDFFTYQLDFCLSFDMFEPCTVLNPWIFCVTFRFFSFFEFLFFFFCTFWMLWLLVTVNKLKHKVCHW